METRIIGFSGKKQSGKNSMCNIVMGWEMCAMGALRTSFRLTEDGKLSVDDLFGNTNLKGIIDFEKRYIDEGLDSFLSDNIDPHIKIYSCADPLKKFCIDVFGLTPEQCYGTDEDKNSLTNLKWQNMPGNVEIEHCETESLGMPYSKLSPKSRGKMTAREVLQYFGTDTCRKMYDNCWAEALIKNIERDRPDYALISDIRFPNEVDIINSVGGKVCRFTRDVLEDSHSSETALDNYDTDNFDIVIDNKEMTIPHQENAVHDWLVGLGYLNQIMS